MRSDAHNIGIDVIQPLATLLATPARGATNILDTQGYDAVGIHLYVGIGGVTFTTLISLGLLLEESDNGSTFTPITDSKAVVAGVNSDDTPTSAGIFGEITSAKTTADTYPLTRKWSYVGGRRYIAIRPGFTGTHTVGTPVMIVVTLNRALLSPF